MDTTTNYPEGLGDMIDVDTLPEVELRYELRVFANDEEVFYGEYNNDNSLQESLGKADIAIIQYQGELDEMR